MVIVGSGPAGYTAAIYAGRANLRPLVFEVRSSTRAAWAAAPGRAGDNRGSLVASQLLHGAALHLRTTPRGTCTLASDVAARRCRACKKAACLAGS